MIELHEAEAYVMAACRPLPPVELPLAEVLGCVTAVELRALEDVPPFVNTAVDGYAVRAADTSPAPVELRVVATMPAGAAPDSAVGPGEAIRIMTGAPMPPGADAVVMVEDTEALGGGDRVRIDRSVQAGDALRYVGDDVHRDDELFAAGTVVTPAMLGVLASVNHRSVLVHPRARVAVLSTGDELVTDGGPLRPGQIRESNKTMLVGAVSQAGCDTVDYGVVPDDEAVLEATLRRAAAECDAIVTSGGVSMGDYDVVKAVLSRIAEMRWMQIAIKPAKPFAFGLLDGTPVFGLPGNPVSSIVSFELLARPALRRMMGHGDATAGRPRVAAIADEALRRRPDGKVHYQRVHGAFGADGRWHVRSTGAQGSHQLASTAAANGLAIVPDGDGIPLGDDVRVLLLDR
ncbi:MAG: gephyrin-like molybdotransferase Glp [Acidimicrobiia bacterium]